MCDFSESTTRSEMRDDLNIIKFKLANIQVEHKLIYKAIEPLATHLIQHLNKVHNWIEVKSNIQNAVKKTPKQECEDEFNDWYANKGYSEESNKDRSRNIWLAARGF